MPYLFLSPHLDDAIFSAGALMAALSERGVEVICVTYFTASVPDPTGFALACQTDKGYAPEFDYMAMRRAEDVAACAAVGAKAVHLPFREAPHRGYESAKMLFAPPLARDADILLELARATQQLIEQYQPTAVFLPKCVGNHVDHWQLRRAVESIRARYPELPFYLWYDQPYLMKHPAERPTGELPSLDVSTLSRPNRQTHSNSTTYAYDASRYHERKMAGCAAYGSQLGFQFGGAPAMREQYAEERVELFEYHSPLLHDQRKPLASAHPSK